MPESVPCNLCGADDAARLYTLRDYRLRVDNVEWPVVQCRRCGLGYLNPRPTWSEIGRYYPGEYFAHRAHARARYERQADYVAGPPRRLLDVGTARGDFLLVMRDRGWDVTGIEPFDDAGNPHDLPIHREPFPGETELELRSFDVVTAWSVFEHLHDPAAAFRECARLLRDGGTLVLQVPNFRSPLRWSRLEDVPRHLYFFSEHTLRAYGDRVGLRLDRVVHATNVSGGSARGGAQFALVRMLGHSTDDFHRIYRSSRGERFRRWPLLAPLWTGIGAAERVVLSDWVVRSARISGQLVAFFRKPAVATSDPDQSDREPGSSGARRPIRSRIRAARRSQL